jgi:RimJ/RimL family protein N-acetyltransferase
MFQSNNLEFRTINPSVDSLENYLSWLRDPLSNPYIIGTDRDFKLDSLIEYVNEKNESKDCALWGIYSRPDLIHIGNIKFEPIQPELGLAWVGILIGEVDFRGKGLGYEALSESISYFSNVSSIRKFYLGVDPQNLPAVKLYESLGFAFDQEESLIRGKSIMYKIHRN